MISALHDRMAEAIRATLARELAGEELERALVETATTVAVDAITTTWLDMMGMHLASLPEETRKARMFDVLVKLEEFRSK